MNRGSVFGHLQTSPAPSIAAIDDNPGWITLGRMSYGSMGNDCRCFLSVTAEILSFSLFRLPGFSLPEGEAGMDHDKGGTGSFPGS